MVSKTKWYQWLKKYASAKICGVYCLNFKVKKTLSIDMEAFLSEIHRHLFLFVLLSQWPGNPTIYSFLADEIWGFFNHAVFGAMHSTGVNMMCLLQHIFSISLAS